MTYLFPEDDGTFQCRYCSTGVFSVLFFCTFVLEKLPCSRSEKGCTAFQSAEVSTNYHVVWKNGSWWAFISLYRNLVKTEDIAVTEQLVQAGRQLDIELVDHLIIGNQRYISLKERMKW
jgi:hypothetical protein